MALKIGQSKSSHWRFDLGDLRMTAGSEDGWYTFRSEEQRGPLPFEQLSHEAQTGTLLKSDFVWRKGFEEWQPAESIAGLFAQAEEISAAPEDRPSRQAATPTGPAPTNSAMAGPPPVPPKQSNYFLRHWRGELSLPVSYWVNGVLGKFAVVAVSLAAPLLLIGAPESPFRSFLSLTVLIAAIIVISIWQLVGIWRSATGHPKRGGRRFWARAAQCMVIFGGFNVAMQLVQGFGPLWAEAARMAIGGDTQFEAARITVLRDGTEIAFEGGINHGALDELTRILDATPNIKTIHLTSGGGRIAEGRRIGAEIARRGLDTFVHTECSSACTAAFLGGKRRWLAKDARLGFHTPDIPGVTGELRASLVADEEQALLKSGLPTWFVGKVLSTSPDDIWYPSTTELRTANVITDIANPDDFATPTSSTPAIREDSIRELLKSPPYSAIREIDPLTFDELAGSMYASARQGKPAREIISEARASMLAAVGKHGWRVSDPAAVHYLSRLHRQLIRLRADDPKACAAIMNPETMDWPADLEVRFPEEFADDHEALAELFLSTKGMNERRLSESQIYDLFAEIMKDLNAETLFFPDEKAPLGNADYAPFCGSTIALLEGALSLPQARQADFARYLIAEE
jgi:hypothetical protein